MPGAKEPGPSIKDDEQYEALRDEGMSKEKAARIANTDRHTAASAAAIPLRTRSGPRTSSTTGPRRSGSTAVQT